MIETALICVLAATILTAVPAVWWHFDLEQRHRFYLLIGWIALASVSFIVSRMWIESTNGSPPYAQIGVLVGVLLATAGWIVSSEFAIRIARKKHTIDLVADYVFRSNQLVADKKCLARALGKAQRVTPELINYDDLSSDTVQALDRLSNFSDFFALAILSREIDEAVAKDMLKSMICYNYVAHEDYILYWRRKDPSTWRHYANLYVRWRSPKDPEPRPL